MRVKESERRDYGPEDNNARSKQGEDDQACDEKREREPKQVSRWHLQIRRFEPVRYISPVVQGKDMSDEQNTADQKQQQRFEFSGSDCSDRKDDAHQRRSLQNKDFVETNVAQKRAATRWASSFRSEQSLPENSK